MVLTLAILITVIIRAATLGPQMCERTVFDLNAHIYGKCWQFRYKLTFLHILDVILQPPYRGCMGVCKGKCNSSSWNYVFWWVGAYSSCLVSKDMLMYSDKQDIKTIFTSKFWWEGNKRHHHLTNTYKYLQYGSLKFILRLKNTDLASECTYHWCCVSAAFICHHNSFLIYGSLEQPSIASWTRVTHVSVGSALIISAAFAVAGYSTFTGFTQGTAQRQWTTHLRPQMQWDFFNLFQETYLRTTAGMITWQHLDASALALAS